MTSVLSGKRLLLVVGGGIAAYKVLELIRRLKDRGVTVTPVMTAAAAEFVTPLSVGTLAASKVYGDLFDRNDEHDVGHIRLARDHDAILVAPATANLMARAANGLADDLATAILLAARAPILMAPAMNPAMWAHPATRRNAERLQADGVRFVGPDAGEMAERNEAGTGRLAEPAAIIAALEGMFGRPADADTDRTHLASPVGTRLAGKRFVVTSGPTHEPIDPVRYLANRSSGRQGHAIAEALARAGAAVMLVSGPVAILDPEGVEVRRVETARQMLEAVEAALPADGAIFVAAVADWRVGDVAPSKLKKAGGGAPILKMVENPDILATVGRSADRPGLVVGFAAETDDLLAHAAEKLARKGADAILANDVSVPADAAAGKNGGVMGGTSNTISFLTRDGVEEWPTMSKEAVAERLVDWIARRLNDEVAR